MKDTRFVFDNFGDTYSYAQSVGMAYARTFRIQHMNAAERQRLAVQRVWVVEMQVRYVVRNTDPARPDYKPSPSTKTRIYADLETFQSDYQSLCLMSCSDFKTKSVEVTAGFAVYQLYHDPDTVIHLEYLSSKLPLSTQLKYWTGSSYNSLDFHDEDQPDSLSAQGIIVHRKTQQKFFIPPVSIDYLVDQVYVKSL
jgi:hypothetical protein